MTDPHDYELTDEEHEALVLISEHAIAPPLSPAAQAMFWAFNSKFSWIEDGVPGPQFNAIAAVLRTVADQLRMNQPLGNTDADAGVFAVHQAICSNILSIADELEGADNA